MHAADIRVGIGYDVHRLVPGRKLILGGVEVPFEKGLLGHSDADVALHAVMDALLGAAGLGDIGTFFPDSDVSFQGADSGELLARVVHMLRGQKMRVCNVDLVIVAQEPRLAPWVPTMQRNIAQMLQLPVGRVGVKATTTEGLGFEGRGEGMSAKAVVLVESKE